MIVGIFLTVISCDLGAALEADPDRLLDVGLIQIPHPRPASRDQGD